MKSKITAYLKPKIASLGFNAQEVEGIVDNLANNLNVKEGATDEEVNAAVQANCDAVIPILQTAQKVSSRVISKYKEDNPIAETPKPADPPKKADMPEWFAEYKAEQDQKYETQNKKYEELLKSQKNKSYTERLATELKEVSPSFYNLMASGKTFENDEEFTAFVDSVKTNYGTFVEEQKKIALGDSYVPPASNRTHGKEASEAEVKEVADILNV